LLRVDPEEALVLTPKQGSGTVEGSNKIQLTYDKIFFKRKKSRILQNESTKARNPETVFNTLKSLEKGCDSPFCPGEDFEWKGFTSHISNKFMVLIFIACLSCLCYERKDRR